MLSTPWTRWLRLAGWPLLGLGFLLAFTNAGDGPPRLLLSGLALLFLSVLIERIQTRKDDPYRHIDQ